MRKYEYQSDLVRRYVWHGRVEGRVQGTVDAVMTVLGVRGFEVSAAAREWITGSRDLAEVEGWLDRAATAESIEDALGPLACYVMSDAEPHAACCQGQVPATSAAVVLGAGRST